MTQPAAIIDQCDLVVPAQRFTQGGRYVYSFILGLPTLDRLLPVRVDERLAKAEDANRPLTLSHAKNIQDYLEKQEKWLFGTMMLGIAPEAIEFPLPLPRTRDRRQSGSRRPVTHSDR